MSTATLTRTDQRPSAAHRRPSLARLTTVELRKLVNTRAGVWLLVAIVASCAVVALVQVLAMDAATHRFDVFFLGTLLPIGILLPVLGILTVTTEWSQRTALTTFALVPARARVITAKLAAAAVVALLSLGASAAIAAITNLVVAATGGNVGWGLDLSVLAAAAVMQLINVTMGVAFGMLLLNTPLAIVTYFVLPTVWSVLGAMVSWLADTARWLDFSLTMAPILNGVTLTGQQWAQLGTTAAAWVLLPLVIGAVRIVRAEAP